MVLHGSSSIVSPPQVHISQVFWLNLRGYGLEEAISASTSALKSGSGGSIDQMKIRGADLFSACGNDSTRITLSYSCIYSVCVLLYV